MEPSVQTDRVADYLADLRLHLEDLDPAERAEVLDELADALREVAAEDDRPLREVLGPPAEYVAAYRASAGLESVPSGPRGRLRARVESTKATLRAQPWWPRVHELAVLLRPAWWTLRGVVLAVALLTTIWPRSQGDVILSLPGMLFVVAAVTASMAVGGGRRDGALRLAVIGVNVMALVATSALIDFERTKHLDIRADGMASGFRDARRTAPDQLTAFDGDPVTNIHPYTRDGEPLEDVLLFDGEGRPLSLARDGRKVYDARGRRIRIEHERDADGQPIANLYPLQQYTMERDRGTGQRIRRPQTAPTIVLPPAMRTDASEAPASEPAVEATAPAAAPSEG
jgi:hypothetical protein